MKQLLPPTAEECKELGAHAIELIRELVAAVTVRETELVVLREHINNEPEEAL